MKLYPRTTTAVVALLASAGAMLGLAGPAHAAADPGPGMPDHYAAPYVEMWNSPDAMEAARAATGAKVFTLAFIINGNGSCNATINGYGAVDDAGWVSAINDLRSHGGDVIASFGGASGTEIAQACGTVASAKAQYHKVIDAMNLTAIDLDVEGSALDDTAANDRRNQALAQLQSEFAAAGKHLAVHYTLPADPGGLPSDAVDLLENAASRGVDVDVVNPMTMDYGGSRDMGQTAIDVANGLHAQLAAIWPAKSSAELWGMEGSTPMIGVNDTTEETFGTQDADELTDFAVDHGMQLLAFWALGRDAECSGGVPQPAEDCSGVAQSPYQFTSTFNRLNAGGGGGSGDGGGVSTSATYALVASSSGKCVDAAGAGTADGTVVQQYACNQSAAQQWQFHAGSDEGYYAIVNQNGSQPVIDVDGPSTASGAAIHLWSGGGWSSQEWKPVLESSGRYHLVNHYSGLCLDVPSASTADSVALQQYTCNGTAAQSFSLQTNTGGGGGGTVPTNPDNPDLGPHVKIFDPSQSASSIQSTINSVYSQQETNQFGSQRYALLFRPGSYDVDVPVGFYTQVAGLGASPDDVSLTGGGIHADAGWFNGNATQNFWRSVENLSVTPSSGTVEWAVSQAAPFRRIDVHGNLTLDDYTSGNTTSNWSSGGYIGNSKISGTIDSGTQQQFLTRNTSMGRWTGSNWNMVFVGDQGAPGQSFPTYTNVAQTPTLREKPFLYVDPDTGLYEVRVPAMRSSSAGTDWTSGTSIPITDFYVVRSGDTADTINAALAAGKNLLVTPGVYHLSSALNITRPNTVVLGLGLPTFVPDNGNAAITTADVDGIDIAGLIVSAGTTNSYELVRIGPDGASADHASNPTVLHDVFVRVGGDQAGKATKALRINADDTIGDHLWIWRADHGDGVGWNTNTSTNGLVVNGDDVMMYGLFVEHFQGYQTVWNGNGGRTYFYQSEMPYDVPNNGSWASSGGAGYASYKVADGVTSHEAWGLGVYCYFSTNSSVYADHAIEVPGSGTRLHDMVTVSLGGTGSINHVVNNSGNWVGNGSTVSYLTTGP